MPMAPRPCASRPGTTAATVPIGPCRLTSMSARDSASVSSHARTSLCVPATISTRSTRLNAAVDAMPGGRHRGRVGEVERLDQRGAAGRRRIPGDVAQLVRAAGGERDVRAAREQRTGHRRTDAVGRADHPDACVLPRGQRRVQRFEQPHRMLTACAGTASLRPRGSRTWSSRCGSARSGRRCATSSRPCRRRSFVPPTGTRST